MGVIEGIISRIEQAVHQSENGDGETYASSVARVFVSAHPAINALLRRHVYYDRVGRGVEWHVSAVEDRNLWRTVVNDLDPTWAPIFDYGEDGAHYHVSGKRLVLSEGTRVLFVVNYNERRISVVYREPRGAFVELYRTIRAVHTWAALTSGAIMLHAATLAVDGKAVCFVGDKGSGKTTALLEAATARIDGLSIVGNDKILLLPGDPITVLAWPSVVNTAPGSMKAAGMLEQIVPSFHVDNAGVAYLLQNLPLIDTVDKERLVSRPSKIRLAPEELRRSINAEFSAEATLAGVVDASLDLDLRNSVVRFDGDPASMARRIDRNWIDVYSNHPDWLGLRGEGVTQARHLADTPVWHIELTAGRDGKDVVRGLLAAVRANEWGRDLVAEGLSVARHHFGVYARIIKDNAVLLVDKTRGPYSGLLDLPGGHPEVGESFEVALRRELKEEVGAERALIGEFRKVSVKVVESSSGAPIAFWHDGVVADVVLGDEVGDLDRASEDTGGFRWVPLGELDARSISAFARAGLFNGAL